ncbi:hypothetical protein PENANT_c001G10802 [Penicillium antarcticum]|uniref:Altered inheritance of mitochondria protein 6 n=1 Tax=Penicillium antarcticum TaxID=416450 RepID=A0A1V6QNI7_9EURO|nr:uncharacterized protein N7508_010406 [Penicillium antarcticum]KAJ5295585.1 hypothetical protein N7508_010406 [Penicillium antarcticum]OQD90758.1 hypothetical protein PENANT_c001G10802 [Penicillium antarcticum]
MSVQPPPQNSSTSLDAHFEPYTDSVNPEEDTNKVNVHVQPVREVGRPARPWRRVLTGSAWTSVSSEDPQLAEQPTLKQRSCCSKFLRGLVRTLVGILIMLGIIQFISIACGIVLSFFPDEYDRAVNNWLPSTNNDPIQIQDTSTTPIPLPTRWPTDISRDITPVACHSHNDYWRRVPLYSALQAGCIGVEADVWLFDEELYVGHTTSSLTRERTLQSMYVNPLISILERQNPITEFHPSLDTPAHGVFDTDPDQSLIFLIDFKTAGPATYHAVVEQLAPLRERGYLTHFNGEEIIQGPITVVGTGNAPFNLINAGSSYRDIFFDAPLDKLVDIPEDDSTPDSDSEMETDSESESEATLIKRSNDHGQGQSGMPNKITANTFNATNSFYASVSFRASIGFPWPFHFTQKQMELIRTQVRIAHKHGLKVRYWALPSWPRSLRNHIWRVLALEGVDVLNVDDLVGATKGEWNTRVFDWWP